MRFGVVSYALTWLDTVYLGAGTMPPPTRLRRLDIVQVVGHRQVVMARVCAGSVHCLPGEHMLSPPGVLGLTHGARIWDGGRLCSHPGITEIPKNDGSTHAFPGSRLGVREGLAAGSLQLGTPHQSEQAHRA